MLESIERQQVRLANDAAERWGDLRPRWWLARYGRCIGAEVTAQASLIKNTGIITGEYQAE